MQKVFREPQGEEFPLQGCAWLGWALLGVQGQGELGQNLCTFRRQVWFSNTGYKYPEKVKNQAMQVTTNLGLKLGGKVRNFSNFYLRKISFEKTKKPSVMWFLAEYLRTAWLEDEEPQLKMPHCSNMLHGLILL